MKCPNCGIETDGQSSYCYQCGAKIERENLSNVTDNGNNAEPKPPLNVTSKAIPVSMPKKKKLFVPVICFLVIFALLAAMIIIPKIIDSSKSSGSYSVSDDFSIEGKWKNVGATTCAQIQSGSIVDFDGSNCNVYSPNDTYAFYRVDGEYHLDCTSGFAGDSLCFTVNIIDSDNIELINGSTTVHLCRVGGTPVDIYNYNTNEDYQTTESTTEAKISNINVPIKTIVYNVTLDSGYKYRVTIKLSPWIFDENIEAINSAWNLTSTENNPLPQTSSEIMDYSPYDTSYYNHLYIATGHITIENLTEGWDFSEANPGGISISSIFLMHKNGYKSNERCTFRVFYANSTEDVNSELYNKFINPKMTSNKWGVDFLIFKGTTISPNYPKGENIDILEAGYFLFDWCDEEINIGVFEN